jgi:hypothetical protein
MSVSSPISPNVGKYVGVQRDRNVIHDSSELGDVLDFAGDDSDLEAMLLDGMDLCGPSATVPLVGG